jgi:hypothetical protein
MRVIALFILILLVGIASAAETPKESPNLLENPSINLEPKVEVKEEFDYMVKLTTSAKETFVVEVKAANPMEAASKLLVNEGSHIVILVPGGEGEEGIATFINKAQITTIQVIRKPKEIPKPVNKDKTA